MKLMDYRGEDALDVLADILDPMTEILSDPDLREVVRSGKPQFTWIKPMIRNHKKAVLEVLARIEGEDPETYAGKVTVLTLPVKVLNLINDPDMQAVFTSVGQRNGAVSSGSVMESTEASGK